MKKTVKRKILKEVNRDMIMIMISDYDENGNLIMYKELINDNEFIAQYEYDDNGNKIHYMSSNGVEYWYEYDDNGNNTHFKNP